MRVLLATDGSEDARTATRWLHDLPLPADATVRVLSVFTPPHSALDIVPVREFVETLRAACRRNAESAAEVLAPVTTAEVRVVEGEPREVIAREASEWPADLVVVGARGLGAVGRFLLGSVSTAVLHAAPGAVAIVRGEARRPGRVLVGYDGSPQALEAVRFCARLPLGADARVRLLGVVTLPVMPAGPDMMAVPWPPTMDAFIDEQRAHLDGALQRAAGELGRDAARVERSVVVGQPATELIDAAEKDADLVIVGARGLGAVGRLVLGSVSDRVVHHAGCPVIVVKRKA
jgi:nucleotide-binding universal stress UspA family protein